MSTETGHVANPSVDKLYWSMDKMDKAACTFNMIIGGRGTGKTYGSLRRAYKENYGSFLLLRRTQTEVEKIMSLGASPFKALNRDLGWHVEPDYNSRSMSKFYEIVDDKPITVGYCAALSTLASFRGFDMSDIDLIIFDEFIGECGVRNTIKNEADVFFNAYETVNRNREIDENGDVTKPATKVILLSNATNIESPLIEELDLVSLFQSMQENHKQCATIRERDLHIELLQDVKISVSKANTALYKLTKSTRYREHALNNKFVYNNFEAVAKVENIKDYAPLVQLEGTYIYKHKSAEYYYATYSKGHCRYVFKGDTLKLFRKQFGMTFWLAMHDNRFIYQTYPIKTFLFQLLDF